LSACGGGRGEVFIQEFHMTVSRFAMGVAAILFAVAWLIPNAIAGQTRTLSFTGLAAYNSKSGKLASGGRFNPNELTAAHRTLPFGTRVRVTDPKSGRSVIVTISRPSISKMEVELASVIDPQDQVVPTETAISDYACCAGRNKEP
jgi:Lytic transglycolase